MSGKLAARAICDHPRYVFGEEDDTAAGSLGTFHVEGDYEGLVVILVVSRSEIESRLPKGLALAPQHLTPSGTHPLVIACGTRRQVGVSRFRQVLSGTYRECMTAVPYVLRQKRGCNCGGGPYLYAPKFYLNSLLVRAGSGLLWRFDVETARIEIQEDAADGDRRSWHVRSLLGRRPILSAKTRGRGSTFSMGLLPASRFSAVEALLSQPVLSLALGGRGPALCARLGWNLKHALVRSADARVTFAHGFLGGGTEAQVESRGILPAGDPSPGGLGSFEIVHSRWQLSLPNACCNCDSPGWGDDEEEESR
jgi:hypothetical protein